MEPWYSLPENAQTHHLLQGGLQEPTGHKLTLCAAGPTRSRESGILDGHDQGSGLGIMPWEVTGGRVTWKSGALTHPRECWEFPGATRVRLGCEPLPKQGRPQTRPAFAALDIPKGG